MSRFIPCSLPAFVRTLAPLGLLLLAACTGGSSGTTTEDSSSTTGSPPTSSSTTFSTPTTPTSTSSTDSHSVDHWSDLCGGYLSTPPVPLQRLVQRDVSLTTGTAYTVGATADGLHAWTGTEWIAQALPALGVPTAEVFPPDQLHTTSGSIRFQGGDHAFWWNGTLLTPAEALVGDWWVTSGADGVAAAEVGALLSTPGSLLRDPGTGTWIEVDTSGIPVDGPLLAVAPSEDDDVLVAIGTTDETVVLLEYNEGVWTQAAEIPFPAVDALSYDRFGRIHIGLSSADGVQGAYWARTSTVGGPVEDTGYAGPPVLAVGQHWDGKLGVLTEELDAMVRTFTVEGDWALGESAPYGDVLDYGFEEYGAYVLTEEGTWSYLCENA